MEIYLFEHPLMGVVLEAFVSQAKRSKVCPCATEMSAVQVANYLSGSSHMRELKPGEVPPNWFAMVEPGDGGALEAYEPIARDVMAIMIANGFLEKVGFGLFKKGDTICRVTEKVVFPADLSIDSEPPRGLSNDWLGACEYIEDAMDGVFDRFSTNAVLAAMDYLLIRHQWVQRNVPDDPDHAFLDCDFYQDICSYFDRVSNDIEPFRRFHGQP